MSDNELTIERIKELRATIPDPPWFVGGDEANECGPHKQSGLALVDTGRSSDWPIARLCEWPTAAFIAASPSIVDFLLAKVDEQGEDIVRLQAKVGGLEAQKLVLNQTIAKLRSTLKE